ncbi:MAG: tail fiber domain-containing protein, partial [Bacteroidota bacterium]
AMEKLQQLKIREYYWKNPSALGQVHGKDIGIIAQELEMVLPEMVKEDTSGMKYIYYYKLIPILIQALKEQSSLIKSQQKDIEKLKHRISENE